jgi:hypothetical protein
MAVATVLDPRFKLQFLSAFYTHIYRTEGKTVEVNKVRELLYKLVLEYQSSMEGVAATDGVHATSKSAAQAEGDDIVFDIFDGWMSSQPAETSFVSKELDLYLDEPKNPRARYYSLVAICRCKVSYFVKYSSRYHGNSYNYSSI